MRGLTSCPVIESEKMIFQLYISSSKKKKKKQQQQQQQQKHRLQDNGN